MTTMELAGKEVRMLELHKTNPNYRTEKKQVFIIGSKGIPANYGGFETFVEKLTEYQESDKIHYHVSRIGDKDFRFEYNGAKCFNLYVPNIGAAKAIYYDVKALKRCIDYCKARSSIHKPVFYVLACRIGPFIHYFKRQIRKLGGVLYVNPDGHEWMRAKWSAPVRKYWKYSERLMVKHADYLICDSKNIERYIRKDYERYNPKTIFIPYGSETRPSKVRDDSDELQRWYAEKRIREKQYYLVVGRFVPENSFETMIREFMNSKTDKDFVIVATANRKFLEQLEAKLHFKNDSRIKFAGTVYDQELLKKIRENAYANLHGHTVGGTNPSLLEALGSTDLNLLVDVGFNKEVAGDGALYWSREMGSLTELINEVDVMPADKILDFGQKARKRIAEEYTWKRVVGQYEEIFLRD